MPNSQIPTNVAITDITPFAIFPTRAAFVRTKAALVGNIANGVISVIATFVGIWLLGKIGRRTMLITGQLGIVATLILLSIVPLFLKGTVVLP